MAEISTTDARALFTKMLIDVYQERIRPTAFLRSFFPTVTAPTKEISIEVERMGEKVAVDVVRGTEGNRNTFSKSTEKIFIPPIYREYFDATQLDLYDRVLGSQGNAQVPLFTALLQSVADRMSLLQDKIERAYEIQAAQVLETGKVLLQSATDIDFKRKAASMVDKGAGAYWATGTVDPFADLAAGADFLRKVGRSPDALYNVIIGSTALADLLTNTKFLARQNLFNMALDSVQGPARGAAGMTFNGTVTGGAYKFQLWGYPQFYDDANGVSQPYWNPKKIAIVPLNPRFKLAFAAVPQLIGEPGQMPVQGAYKVGEFIDQRKAVHDFDIQSAGVAIPIAVDTIYTLQVVA